MAIVQINIMKTKLTFLLTLTFLFLFSCSSFVFGGDNQDFQDGVDAYKRKDYKEVTRPPKSSPNVKLIKTIW